MSTEAGVCPAHCIHGRGGFKASHSSSINKSVMEPLIVDGFD